MTTPSPAPASADSDVATPIRTAEFFAGIGLVGAALEPLGFDVVWANDIERAKRDLYLANHPTREKPRQTSAGEQTGKFLLGDVRNVHPEHLPSGIELATSSFPCIDLSLAGNRLGLAGTQSGMFYEFARVLKEQAEQDRPTMVLLENVHGFATSHGGTDLRRALGDLGSLGYSTDVFAVDARHFVPQSRPRMFVVGIKGELPASAQRGIPPISDVRPAWVQGVHSMNIDLNMHYLPLPSLPDGPQDLSGVAQRLAPSDARWWDTQRTQAFVDSLSPIQLSRLEELRDAPSVSWRTAYRRTRKGVAVWELRRDGIAGCLRTTGGGSSRQALVQLGKRDMRIRWMTPLEYARLMGAGSYKLRAGTPNQALFGFGDAVVVDVIDWIGRNYIQPVLRPPLS